MWTLARPIRHGCEFGEHSEATSRNCRVFGWGSERKFASAYGTRTEEVVGARGNFAWRGWMDGLAREYGHLWDPANDDAGCVARAAA